MYIIYKCVLYIYVLYTPVEIRLAHFFEQTESKHRQAGYGLRFDFWGADKQLFYDCLLSVIIKYENSGRQMKITPDLSRGQVKNYI